MKPQSGLNKTKKSPKKPRTQWVDYKMIKSQITIEMVLVKYGLRDQFKRSGQNLVGCCPLHQGSNPRAFSVNEEKNIWHCFGDCKMGGNILDFVALKEWGKNDPPAIRQAALLLSRWFGITSDSPGKPKSKRMGNGKRQFTENMENTGKKTAKTAPTFKPKPKNDQAQPLNQAPPQTKNEQTKYNQQSQTQTSDEETNQPLTFQLRDLEPAHPFLEDREILPQTARYFGIGYCRRGMMKGRIAIPIHNQDQQIVAYCGRAVSEKQSEEEGKYRLPAAFHKQLELYNLHRLPQNPKYLILVESFLSVWKLHQAGFSQTVALMGSSLGKTQQKLILGLSGVYTKLILCFDQDESGKKCTNEVFQNLGQERFCKTIDLSHWEVRKPHQLKVEEIKKIMEQVL